MELSLKPDRRLLTKQWIVLFTISFYAFLACLLLVLLVPLAGKVSADDIGRIAWPVTAGGIGLMWLIMVPILILWVKNLRYEIEEDKVTIYKGILTKVQKNIPYRAITDFMVHRSLFDRFLGIASIRIQTAGQSQTAVGYEGNLAGLKDWAQLHERLRARVKSLHPFSDSLGVMESASGATTAQVLEQILEELKAIRKALEKS
jgi:uncharacterized membrane protein YdbT with pleckstrin-like domain